MKCCDIVPGKFRIPVEFQARSRTANGSGGFTESWAAISGAPTFAEVKALGGGERYASDRVEASARYRLTCRYDGNVTEASRVVIRSRAYNIRFINNVEFRNRYMIIDLDGGVAV
jgi:SPP1 family predicted phage head-tail adaptor